MFARFWDLSITIKAVIYFDRFLDLKRAIAGYRG
jgi:hypothetical protein